MTSRRASTSLPVRQRPETAVTTQSAASKRTSGERVDSACKDRQLRASTPFEKEREAGGDGNVTSHPARKVLNDI